MSLFTTLAKAGGGILAGREQAKKDKKQDSINERLLAMKEQDQSRASEAALRDEARLTDERENRAADNVRLDKDLALRSKKDSDDETERQRRIGLEGTEHTRQSSAAAALRLRLQALDPSIKPEMVNGLNEEELTSQIDNVMRAKSSLQNVEAAHRLQQDQQLIQIRRAQIIAQSSAASIDRQIKQIQQNPKVMTMFYKGQTNSPAYRAFFDTPQGNLLDAQQQAAQQIQDARTQAALLGAHASPSPATDAATDKQMPFATLPPEQQAAQMADVAAQLKAGKSLDLPTLAARGVPVADIAAKSGYQFDDFGIAQPVAAATPTSDFSMLSGGGPGDVGAKPVGPFTSGMRPSASPLAGLFSKFGQPSLLPGQAPTTTPPRPSPTLNPQGPVPVSPAAASIFTQPPAPMRSPLFPAPSTVAPQNPSNVALQGLSAARSMPDAENAARQLLNTGTDYDAVIAATPVQFQQLLKAKLPRRVPTMSAPNAPVAAPSPIVPPAAPIFSPPSY